MIADLNSVLGDLPYAEYNMTVDDGAATNLETELGVAFGIKIDLGAGLSVKQTRGLLREQGIFLYGQDNKTATYTPDPTVARPGKSWGDLTLNAVGGLWEFVKDGFSWVSQQVNSGVSWSLEIISRSTDSVIRGSAHLIVPAGIQLRQDTQSSIGANAANSVTVTAISWAPDETESRFVVGGVYDLQPYDLTLNPAGTLVINYTDAAVAGVDESQLRLFRWNAQGNHWEPMPAQADLVQNTFTATISQLGIYALGYDAIPPEITIVDPSDGSSIENTLPSVAALLRDEGTGIEPTSVQMQVDGQIVPASYTVGNGDMSYIPNIELSAGLHRVTVSARDIMGNTSSVTASFTVGSAGKTYLPFIQH
jgi:hypothetical protein